MTRLNRITGWFLIFSLPAIVVGLFGFAIFDTVGAVLMASLSVLVILTLSLSAEERLIRFYSARLSGNRSYLRRRDQAIERTLRRLTTLPPRLLIIDSPEPLLYVTRNAWGRGSILLSEGWLSSLNESDLSAWLSVAVAEVGRPELVLQTLACQLADRIRVWAPRLWMNFLMQGSFLNREQKRLPTIQAFLGLISILLIQYFLSIANPQRRSLQRIFEKSRQAAQKHAFCFLPIQIDASDFQDEKNRHNLIISQQLG